MDAVGSTSRTPPTPPPPKLTGQSGGGAPQGAPREGGRGARRGGVFPERGVVSVKRGGLSSKRGGVSSSGPAPPAGFVDHGVGGVHYGGGSAGTNRLLGGRGGGAPRPPGHPHPPQKGTQVSGCPLPTPHPPPKASGTHVIGGRRGERGPPELWGPPRTFGSFFALPVSWGRKCRPRPLGFWPRPPHVLAPPQTQGRTVQSHRPRPSVC